ncbi:PLP-dependent aminotransferase family protein [soil metagenome]
MSNSPVSWLDDLSTDYSKRSGNAGARVSRRSVANTVAYLSGGLPDPRELPRDTVIEATATALEREGEWALQYGPSAGDPNLIEALLDKLRRDQGIIAGPENVLITAGASQAVALATRMLVDPGDIVISEAPTWTGAVRRFAVHGADVREIDVDADGANVGQLESTLKSLASDGRRASMLYILPNFQNPMGVTSRLERRQRIVDLARQYQTPIIEDDAYFDLRYDGEQVPTLYTLASGESVMYMGTYSKNMAAGIRLGWTIADQETIRRLIALKLEGGTSPFASQVAAEWTQNGTLQSHVAMLRSHYGRKRDVMLDALDRHMPHGVRWTRPEGGFFIWVTMPERVDSTELASTLAEAGVHISAGPGFYHSNRGHHEFRLSYSYPTDEEIEAGIQILGSQIADRLG